MNEIKAHVLICKNAERMVFDAEKIEAIFRKELFLKGLDKKIKIMEVNCSDFCKNGSIVIIYPEEVYYNIVEELDVVKIVENHLCNGQIVEQLLFKKPSEYKNIPDYNDLSFYKKQNRLVLANCGYINPESIEEYICADGYEALSKVLLKIKPEEVIESVKKSGLRGRGGGGFPTGIKWEFAYKAKNNKKYVVCNADEGDPGAFMDRSLLEGDPHRIIEGMAICGYAIGADEGYVYVRTEYPLAIKRLQRAIEQAELIGILGNNIFNSGFDFHIKIKEGAGAFVCGEETALLASIEGLRGMPKSRPPFPSFSGLWGKPTNINNVETFANIPVIFSKGVELYSSVGTKKSKGTKVFALTGKVSNTGLAEVPIGITMREIIYEIGGGIPDGKKFKAVQIGGPSGGCLPKSLLDLSVDYDSLIEVGAMMGSGGLVVMDETTCMVDVARFFINFTQNESCGKCTPCREGTKRMLEILTRIIEGKGKLEDISLLESLSYNIKMTALCGMGQTAPNPVLSTLHFFRDEYEKHIIEKCCPAGVCVKLAVYKITEICKGCGLCKKTCPVNAISGKMKTLHIIDQKTCIKCGICIKTCPFKVINKG